MHAPNTPDLASPAARTLARLPSLWQWLEKPLDALRPLACLLARIVVAKAFFLSGLTKVRDWDTTLLLFQEEYKVPVLSPQIAAVMGTGGELVLPVLLVLGLGGRVAALGLSVVNVMAVLSLPEIAPAALEQHIGWGVMLAALAVFGSGPWALDRLWAHGTSQR